MTRNACGWRHHNENEPAIQSCPLTWTCATLMFQGISLFSAMSPGSKLRHCFNVIVLSVVSWTIPNPQGSNIVPSRARHDVWSLLLLSVCIYVIYIYKKRLVNRLLDCWLVFCDGLHDLRISDHQWFGFEYWTHALFHWLVLTEDANKGLRNSIDDHKLSRSLANFVSSGITIVRLQVVATERLLVDDQSFVCDCSGEEAALSIQHVVFPLQEILDHLP